jgi:hypothetical protein
MSSATNGGAAALEELISDPHVAAAAHLSAMARYAASEGEPVGFYIAKRHGPSCACYNDGNVGHPFQELLPLSRRLVKSAVAVTCTALGSNVPGTSNSASTDEALVAQAVGAVIACRRQNQESHAGYLSVMRIKGDMHCIPAESDRHRKIRRPIQQLCDVAMGRQIAAYGAPPFSAAIATDWSAAVA